MGYPTRTNAFDQNLAAIRKRKTQPWQKPTPGQQPAQPNAPGSPLPYQVNLGGGVSAKGIQPQGPQGVSISPGLLAGGFKPPANVNQPGLQLGGGQPQQDANAQARYQNYVSKQQTQQGGEAALSFEQWQAAQQQSGMVMNTSAMGGYQGPQIAGLGQQAGTQGTLTLPQPQQQQQGYNPQQGYQNRYRIPVSAIQQLAAQHPMGFGPQQQAKINRMLQQYGPNLDPQQANDLATEMGVGQAWQNQSGGLSQYSTRTDEQDQAYQQQYRQQSGQGQQMGWTPRNAQGQQTGLPPQQAPQPGFQGGPAQAGVQQAPQGGGQQPQGVSMGQPRSAEAIESSRQTIRDYYARIGQPIPNVYQNTWQTPAVADPGYQGAGGQQMGGGFSGVAAGPGVSGAGDPANPANWGNAGAVGQEAGVTRNAGGTLTTTAGDQWRNNQAPRPTPAVGPQNASGGQAPVATGQYAQPGQMPGYQGQNTEYGAYQQYAQNTPSAVPFAQWQAQQRPKPQGPAYQGPTGAVSTPTVQTPTPTTPPAPHFTTQWGPTVGGQDSNTPANNALTDWAKNLLGPQWKPRTTQELEAESAARIANLPNWQTGPSISPPMRGGSAPQPGFQGGPANVGQPGAAPNQTPTALGPQGQPTGFAGVPGTQFSGAETSALGGTPTSDQTNQAIAMAKAQGITVMQALQTIMGAGQPQAKLDAQQGGGGGGPIAPDAQALADQAAWFAQQGQGQVPLATDASNLSAAYQSYMAQGGGGSYNMPTGGGGQGQTSVPPGQPGYGQGNGFVDQATGNWINTGNAAGGIATGGGQGSGQDYTAQGYTPNTPGGAQGLADQGIPGGYDWPGGGGGAGGGGFNGPQPGLPYTNDWSQPGGGGGGGVPPTNNLPPTPNLPPYNPPATGGTVTPPAPPPAPQEVNVPDLPPAPEVWAPTTPGTDFLDYLKNNPAFGDLGKSLEYMPGVTPPGEVAANPTANEYTNQLGNLGGLQGLQDASTKALLAGLSGTAPGMTNEQRALMLSQSSDEMDRYAASAGRKLGATLSARGMARGGAAIGGQTGIQQTALAGKAEGIRAANLQAMQQQQQNYSQALSQAPQAYQYQQQQNVQNSQAQLDEWYKRQNTALQSAQQTFGQKLSAAELGISQRAQDITTLQADLQRQVAAGQLSRDRAQMILDYGQLQFQTQQTSLDYQTKRTALAQQYQAQLSGQYSSFGENIMAGWMAQQGV